MTNFKVLNNDKNPYRRRPRETRFHPGVCPTSSY